MEQKTTYACRRRVYVWEFPVRLAHWLNVLSIAALVFTGFYIARTFIYTGSNPAYTMGWMRLLHLSFGYLLLAMVALRIIWAFMGNRYASWRTWLPHTREQWHDVLKAIKFHLFIGRESPVAVGHTQLANLVYFFVYAGMVVEIFTGFALFTVDHYNFTHMLLGGWLLWIFTIPTIRLIHYIGMYGLLFFALAHIYLAWYLDTVETNGLLGSIFGGFKFIREEDIEPRPRKTTD